MPHTERITDAVLERFGRSPLWSWGEVRQHPYTRTIDAATDIYEFFKINRCLPSQDDLRPSDGRKFGRALMRLRERARRRGVDAESLKVLKSVPAWSFSDPRREAKIRKVKDLIAFMTLHKRPPLMHEPHYGFMCSIRTDFNCGRLAEVYIRMCEACPCWSWARLVATGRRRASNKRRALVEKIRQFVIKHGRFPRGYDKQAPETALVLAVANLRTCYWQELLPEELVPLCESIPLWRWSRIPRSRPVPARYRVRAKPKQKKDHS